MLVGIGVGVPFGVKKRRILVSDNFNRSDNSTSMGNAETGQSWTAAIGTWGINGNKVYCPSDTNGDLALLEANGNGNFIVSCTLNGQTTSTNQRFFNVVFRAFDTQNFLFTRISGTGVQLFKSVAGTLTTIAANSFSAVDNIDYKFKIVCSGNIIMIYIDGNLVINHTLSGSDTAFATYTKVGLRQSKSGVPTGTARADNLLVEV